MIEFYAALSRIYALYLKRGGEPISRVEHFRWAQEPIDVSGDLARNEGDYYRALAGNGFDALRRVYEETLNDMRGQSFEDCGEALRALDFVQFVAATALWKHHLAVGEPLEAFAKSFDRLDVPSERSRLYELAQAPRERLRI